MKKWWRHTETFLMKNFHEYTTQLFITFCTDLCVVCSLKCVSKNIALYHPRKTIQSKTLSEMRQDSVLTPSCTVRDGQQTHF